jgi:PAS domain S-box-containing protein
MTTMSDAMIRALNVNDDDAARYAITRMLRSVRFVVHEAATARDALTAVKAAPLDIVVLDVKLPDEDGRTACRTIKAASGPVPLPVILVSAVCVEDVDQVEGFESGADMYLTAPVDPSVLVAAIRVLVHARRAHIELLERERGARADAEAAATAMRANDAKLRAVFRSLSEGVVFFNTRGEVEEVNDAVERRFGESLRDLTDPQLDLAGQTVRPDGTPLPRDEQPAIVALRTGQPVHGVELGVPTSDGQTSWRVVSAQPVHDSEGVLLGAVASFFDVTERKRAQDALRLQSGTAMELLTTLDRPSVFELLAERIASVADAAIVSVNEFEPRTRTIIVRSVQCAAETRARVIALMGRDPEGLSLDFPERIRERWKSGELALVPGGVHDLLFEQVPAVVCERLERELGLGDIFGMACAYEDDILGTVAVITRRRGPVRNQKLIEALVAQAALALKRIRADEATQEAKEKLEEADRRKNQFLAVLSHELRNPLAPIKNGLYLLERAAPGGDQARRAQEIIARQVDQLARLVDDLLDVTRITRGKVELQCRRVELGEIVRRTIEDHRSVFQAAEVRLELEGMPQRVFVNADADRVSQIVGNLLHNAAKFTRRHGRVVVSVSTDPGANHAVIRVADTGVGMAPEMLGHLFEPFMQADTTLDRSKGGLGLGLALVKGLVELHGGAVEARSAGLGRGAEFVVRLPLDPDAAGADERRPAAVAKIRCRVLVIEDNIDAADSLGELLQFEDHDVVVAYNGPDGIAKAREFEPEVVLCDIGLPGMDGYEVARAFRADDALRHIRLVALSGYTLPDDVQRAYDAGFDRHIAKPPGVEKLDEVFADLLEPKR